MSILDDVLKNVIRSRGFTDSATLSSVLARPDIAGLIVRRPKWCVAPDLTKHGATFSARVNDTAGSTRRIMFSVAGAWPVLAKQQEPVVSDNTAQATTAWCLAAPGGQAHWIALSLSMNCRAGGGRTRNARIAYMGGVTPTYVFNTRNTNVAVEFTSCALRAAAENVLRARCRAEVTDESLARQLPELCRIARAFADPCSGASDATIRAAVWRYITGDAFDGDDDEVDFDFEAIAQWLDTNDVARTITAARHVARGVRQARSLMQPKSAGD